MTSRTSEVAVCCSSDSVRSRVVACRSSNSRTFSIAITAWSAKVCTSSICLAVKAGLDRGRSERADASAFSHQRREKCLRNCR